MNPTIYNQLPGEPGIFQTINMMRELVNKNFLHPYIRERAATIVRECYRKKSCEDTRLLAWVNSTVQYLRDPLGVEALHNPVSFTEAKIRRGEKPFGDCDDMSIYLATLLKSIGHDPMFRILSRTGNSYHHVHVWCDGNLLDPTLMLGRLPREAAKAVLIRI